MGINDYRLPIQDFTKRFQQRCKTCDHYYAMTKAENGRFYKGHFCCHWGDTNLGTFDKRELIKMCNADKIHCLHYRDRRNKNHPFNSIRKNKLYLDMNPVEYL